MNTLERKQLDDLAERYMEAVLAVIVIKGMAAGQVDASVRADAEQKVDAKTLVEVSKILNPDGLSAEAAVKGLFAIKARARQIEAERAALAKAAPQGSA